MLALLLSPFISLFRFVTSFYSSHVRGAGTSHAEEVLLERLAHLEEERATQDAYRQELEHTLSFERDSNVFLSKLVTTVEQEERHEGAWYFSLAMRLASRIGCPVFLTHAIDMEQDDPKNYYAVIELPSGPLWMQFHRRDLAIFDDMLLYDEPQQLEPLDQQGRRDRMRQPLGYHPLLQEPVSHRAETMPIPSITEERRLANAITEVNAFPLVSETMQQTPTPTPTPTRRSRKAKLKEV